MGCSGVTAWRRLRDWTEAGVWPRLHAVLLAELRRAGLLELDDCAVDGSHVRALKGGDHIGPSPVDRARPGSKYHLIVDRHGTPLAVTLTGGNRHDVTQLLPLLDAVPSIRGLRGRPRRRPRRLYADRGYDFDKYRRLLWKRGIKSLIARRGVAHGSGLGRCAGWSSVPSPGCTSSSGSAPATNDVPISTRACSIWPAASYVCVGSSGRSVAPVAETGLRPVNTHDAVLEEPQWKLVVNWVQHEPQILQRLGQGDEPEPIRVRALAGCPCLEQRPHASQPGPGAKRARKNG